MQQKFVTYSPDLFDHFDDPEEDEDDYEEQNVMNGTFDSVNVAANNRTSKKFDKSFDIVKIFDRRRKIRKHGCKYLPLIGSNSFTLNRNLNPGNQLGNQSGNQ